MHDVISRLTDALADRYRIEREIGAGGMATVYLAHDIKHERDVAIKVLHPDLGAALGGERFLTEIRTTARLQHPHILPLLDSGDAGNGLLYYVMPLVTGETLRARLSREKQLPVEDAVQIAREVADALQYAHVQNVIHRDIKPENILLQGGHALVADFGIALAVQSAAGARMTQTGLSLGTPSYMSPEQAMGERTIDARSDIYALGAVTYEMLTGEPPFTGATMQAIVAKVVNAEPERPSLTRKTLSPTVEAAVLKALAKLPADRFGTAAAFSEALKTSSGDASNPRRTTTFAPTTSHANFAWRSLAAGLALGMATMYGAMRLGIVANNGATASARNVFRNTQVTFSGEVAVPALSPGGDVLAYVRGACEQPGHSAFSAGTLVPCRMSLVVQDSGSTTPVTVLNDVPFITAVRWSGDGTSLFFTARLDSLREGLFVIPRLGGVARRIGALGTFDVQANGDTILLLPATADRQSTRYARFIVPATGAVTDSIPIPMARARSVAWSPNGKLIVFSNSTNLVITNRSGTPVDSAPTGLRQTLRWTPDGSALLAFRAAPGRDDEFVRIPIKSNGHFGGDRAVLLPRMQTNFRGDFDIARRTGRVALITGNTAGDQWTFDITPTGANTARQITRGTTWYADPELSPDGQSLYYLRGDAIGDNLYSVALGQPAAPEMAVSAAPATGWGNSTHVSADGRRVVYRTDLHPETASDSSGIFEMDVASRQTRTIGAGLPWYSVPIGKRGFVGPTAAFDSIVMKDSVGGVARIMLVPDSLRIIDYAVSPDETHMVVQVNNKTSSAIGVIDLTGAWNFRVIARFNEPDATARVSWSADGNIYFPRWIRGDNAPKLFRVPSAGGLVSLVMLLPQRCALETVIVAAAAPIGACQVQDTRSDVYLASIPGVTR